MAALCPQSWRPLAHHGLPQVLVMMCMVVRWWCRCDDGGVSLTRVSYGYFHFGAGGTVLWLNSGIDAFAATPSTPIPRGELTPVTGLRVAHSLRLFEP